MSRFTRVVGLLVIIMAIAAVATVDGPQDADAREPGNARGNPIIDSYIVTLKPGVEPRGKVAALARSQGVVIRHVYESALLGFSATIPSARVKQLQNDPDVLSIVQDLTVSTFIDERPSGIRRSEADRNAITAIGSGGAPVDVDVAVIDTGIDPNHPDLNVVGGMNCVSTETSWADGQGHGTHVAGTIGAIENGSGVVGVAPGARLWAVRVLDSQGQGSFSDVICGIDWVTAQADVIDVANLSLGGEGPTGDCLDGSLRQAVCAAVAAGVTVVVAAGNSGIDAATIVPASFPEAITVSAIVDTDGAPGGQGPTAWFYGNDDTLAFFSNYGASIDIAAPGYNILSTWLGGGYQASSGTSMASPHVAGAAAIYRSVNPGASPADVRAHLLAVSWAQSSPNGFSNDRDSFPEPLLNAGAVGGLPPLPPPDAVCDVSPSSATVSANLAISCANFQGSEVVSIYLDSVDTLRRGLFFASANGNGSATVSVPAVPGGPHVIIARGDQSGKIAESTLTVLPTAKMSASSGKVGAFTYATLTGYQAGEPIDVRWHASSTSVTILKSGVAGANGSATIFFSIPEATAGTHRIEVTGTTSAAVNAEYTVVPGVTLSTTIGKVGGTVTATMRGYAAGEQVTVLWTRGQTSTVLGTVTASSLGTAALTFTVPEAWQGTFSVEGTGASGSYAAANFAITPGMAASTTTGAAGDVVTIALTGFGANESIAINWFDTATSFTQVDTVTASSLGSAVATISIPDATSGLHRVQALSASSGPNVSLYFIVKAAIALSPPSGANGSTVEVAVTGFRAGDTVNIRWYATATTWSVATSVNVSSTGSGNVSFVVPEETTAGNHKVEAVNATSSVWAQATFVAEGTTTGPPPAASCTVAPDSGRVGSFISVTCASFGASEIVRIHLDSVETFQRGGFFTDANGSGSVTIAIPEATYGEHALIMRGGSSGFEVSRPLTVEPGIVMSSASVKPGQYVSVILRGFGASERVDVRWHGASGSPVVISSPTTNANGTVYASIVIPDAAFGDYTVDATGVTTSAMATTSVGVIPGLTLLPAVAQVGAPVTATVRGFSAGEATSVRWQNGDGTSVPLGSVTVNDLGRGTVTFVVPNAAQGTYQIYGEGSSGIGASAPLTVYPTMKLMPTSGKVGSDLTLAFAGYAASEQIAIRWYDTATAWTHVISIVVSPVGSATVTISVPPASQGTHRIQSVAQTSATDRSAYFVVVPAIALSPASGPAGTVVNVDVSGYRAGETVRINWYVTLTGFTTAVDVTANATGSGSGQFEVPANASAGGHKVEAVGLTSGARANVTFNVQ